jgi:acyl-coenzyme A thioesterase PaaI-like protein
VARLEIPQSIEEWNARGRDNLPGHLGMEVLDVEPDAVRIRMPVSRTLCAWKGYLHARR